MIALALIVALAEQAFCRDVQKIERNASRHGGETVEIILSTFMKSSQTSLAGEIRAIPRCGDRRAHACKTPTPG
ncbi:hypothetical protein [Caballeronia sp. TF1N1]|uniref:hypothetical protein n=1 Tax=Caballeronia sp. TF1N1 TaxID=2878153 RepID=UPI001FD063DA|nr:hypothetical protein [Caballeronia sp. TF1N1]